MPAPAAPAPGRPALPAPPAPAYYPALTGLRALAAYLVFWFHFPPPGLPGWAGRLLGQGYVGVSLFFVLSGFVIATRYQGAVQLAWPWWRRYLGRRAARLYPAYFVLNGAALWHTYWPVPPGQGGRILALVALSQSLLRGFSRTLKYVGLPQGWSLTVEECFYLAAPLLLVAWRRRGLGGALGFGAAVLGAGLLLTALCRGQPALHGLFGSYRHLFNHTFFGRVLEFGLGVGVARWWAARPPQPAPRWLWPWRTLAGAALALAVLALLAALNSPTDWYDGKRYPAAIVLANAAFPAAVALLLAGLLAEKSALRKLLAAPLAQALGRSSYFFYLLHIGFLSQWWQTRFGTGAALAGQFLATIVLAEIGYRGFEEPVRRWLVVNG